MGSGLNADKVATVFWYTDYYIKQLVAIIAMIGVAPAAAAAAAAHQNPPCPTRGLAPALKASRKRYSGQTGSVIAQAGTGTCHQRGKGKST
jgi:hypothetical protein